MTGPKLNEKNFVAGERSGTRASALYVRSSANKARLVLNVIRNLPVRQADEVLQFTEKGIAPTVRKVLASAVANAQHNDAQDADELYVKACFADEGPTLRRFAARARGRGTRINKRTCHITIIVDRLDDERLAVLQAKEAARTGAGRRRGPASGAAARRERVARSRQRAGAGAGDAGTGAAADAAPEEPVTTEQQLAADTSNVETPTSDATTETTTDAVDGATDAAADDTATREDREGDA